MKKILSAALALLLALSLFACAKTPEAPEGEGEAKVRPGEETEVSFYLSETEDIACYNLLVEYDRECLEYVRTRPTTVQGLESYDEDTANGVKLAYYTATVTDLGEAPAATLVFRVKEDCAKETLVLTAKAYGILQGLDERGDETQKLPDETLEATVLVDLG